MTMKYVLPVADGVTTIYCPYHRVWEVYLGEDPALCEWCCMILPCPMHGDSHGNNGSGLDVYDRRGVGFDPFQLEDELSVVERVSQMKERLARRKAMREVVGNEPRPPTPAPSDDLPDEQEVDDWIEIDAL